MQTQIYSLGGGLKPAIDADLEIGQIIWLNGYGQSPTHHERRVIYGRRVGQSLGRIMYDFVNVDTLTLGTETAYTIRPVSQLFGIGIYYTPGDMFEDAANIQDWVARARVNEAELKVLEQASQAVALQAKETKTAELLADYFYLETVKGSKKSSHALGAANIRKELARVFPGVKFSVRSDSYSGGDSIDVSWTDGPTSSEVTKYTDKYQECDFDGMTDSESYRHGLFSDLFGGAKYVHESRSISPALVIEVAAGMGYTITTDQYGQPQDVDYELGRTFIREAYQTSKYTPEPVAAPITPVVVEGVTVRRNEDKGGIEVVFSAKPDRAVLDALKSHGFRWSQRQGLWWSKFSEESWAFANSLVN